ncbi:helix-turn-helix transcriptional regulator [Virgibacillus soli]|uniref:Helix-turn-helix transcriptional regulator n=1 Tax=Paracerasibacillus soli TaxID=480284 RepID=A0ABU5CWB4_9BACI|nr:helix-turn-helix transcriptional regulator [Virgibacillus soli]MDY0410127.1 helix-turn-helix transcriptional regulator [Virgibacillus soli]
MLTITLKDGLETRIFIAEKGRSMRGFAKDIGISHAYLSQILNKKRNPSPAVAHKIACGLEKEIEDIFLIQTVDVTTDEKAIK